MSFATIKHTVEDGDTVIVYIGYGNMLTFPVQSGETFQTKYGAIKHSELIGLRYGSKFQCLKGWVYILHPTPELWTVNLPHRTQILYTTNISQICMQLDLRPGAVVIEAGTGSGSLSHALIRTVKPTGHLHTFEFHAERAEKAREEFLEHGLSDNVTVRHRDVCEQGFDMEAGIADALFLDLPGPWKVIQSAKLVLKKQGGRICTFSPCIEQVKKTCEALAENGFYEQRTIECLSRSFDIRTVTMTMPNLGFASDTDFSTGGGDSAGTQVSDHAGENDHQLLKRKRESEPINWTDGDHVMENMSSASCSKTEASNSVLPPSNRGRHNKDSGRQEVLIGQRSKYGLVFKTGISPYQMTGHTGFLTFATLYAD